MASFSRDNLLRTKARAYAINLDGKQSEETHWVSLFINKDKAVYFNHFAIEYIPEED